MATSHMTKSNQGARWRVALWGSAAGLLLLPAMAMQFTDEVNWGSMDFVIAASMLAAVCGGFELAARTSASGCYRAAAGLALVTAFALLWVNMAVGIIDGEGNPANLLFGCVVAVAIAGTLLARGQPRGMVRAMLAAAWAEGLVAGLVFAAGWGAAAAVLSAAFVLPWLVSAGLFRRSMR